MAETKTADDASFGMKLRTRKSGALADISNVVSQVSDAAKRVLTSGSKRKSLGSTKTEKELDSSSSDGTTLKENPAAEGSTSHSKRARKSLDNSSNATNSGKPNSSEVVMVKTSVPQKLGAPAGFGKDPDPAKCLKDIDGMYALYHELEEKYSAKPYMQKQNDINYKMRAILIDWLVEIHFKFKLHPSTLWLCVNILDRYLETEVILRSKLQLIGVTALFIACKFEEVFPPLVKDCIYITDCAYDQTEMLQMETKILTVLNWQILVPTGFHFLTRYLSIIKASERTRQIASYYAERNLQEVEAVQEKPHMFAAAAVYASLMQQNTQYESMNKAAWPEMLVEESGIQESDLIHLAKVMIKHVSEEPETTSKRKLIATKRKYGLSKFNRVAELVLPTFD